MRKISKRCSVVLFLVVIAGFPKPAMTPVAPVYATTKVLVSSAQQQAWNKVAWCETNGDWNMHGSTFSGGLGISNVVWNEYGGQQFAPHAGLATPQEQMVVAIRINGTYVPDQYGCEGAW